MFLSCYLTQVLVGLARTAGRSVAQASKSSALARSSALALRVAMRWDDTDHTCNKRW